MKKMFWLVGLALFLSGKPAAPQGKEERRSDCYRHENCDDICDCLNQECYLACGFEGVCMGQCDDALHKCKRAC